MVTDNRYMAKYLWKMVLLLVVVAEVQWGNIMWKATLEILDKRTLQKKNSVAKFSYAQTRYIVTRIALKCVPKDPTWH